MHNYYLEGTLALSFDSQGFPSIQFLPNNPGAIDFNSLQLNGTGQLLRNGQFEFVSSMFNSKNHKSSC